ncbi:MAG: lytic transglycosylase domain-containing protein [Candidatus Gastranaerophilaceae bacterium]|jgi:soluble lytic murein transglycosylase-like protein
MFSSSIQGLIDQSGAEAAAKRAMQLESTLNAQIQSVKSIEPPKQLNGKTFSDFMNVVPPSDLKFKVSEPEKASKSEIQNIIKEASDTFGVDSRLINAVIKQESGYNSKAVSGAGALGLMQLMPSTAKHLGVTNPMDAKENVIGGTKYLKSLLDRFNGNIVLALAAYNAGPNAVSKYNGIPPYKETQNYVKSILKNYLS